MKPSTQRAVVGSFLLSLAARPATASSSHRHLHRHHALNHTHGHGLELVKKNRLVNRAGQCAFPESEGLVAVTPDSTNAGWAMSPDQECTAGSYCPFACPPGQLMNQWKPGTTYVYPESMDGGLYCDEDGAISKPFPGEDYCIDGIGNVNAVNNCGQTVAFCQTVLPGNENMLIPTAVDSTATLAVPGTSYWDATAAHFYVNPPGYNTDEACAWGTSAKPIGNWSPYVAGTNQDATGNTYVKLGWNPIYTGAYAGVNPSFGLKIECDGDCVGLPCSIDPSTDGFGGVTSDESATGAGGADFCVVTVTSGSANIVVFNTDGSTGDDSSGSGGDDSSGSSAGATSVSSAGESAGTTWASSWSSSWASSWSWSYSTYVEEAAPTESAVLVMGLNVVPTNTLATTTSTFASATATLHHYHAGQAPPALPTLLGGVFREDDSPDNGTVSFHSATSSDSSSGATAAAAAAAAPAATTSKKSDARNPKQGQAAFAGLAVAIVAAACLF